MLTHTDLDRFDQLVAESVRVLAPAGVMIYVGVHPCFVSPFAEPMSDEQGEDGSTGLLVPVS